MRRTLPALASRPPRARRRQVAALVAAATALGAAACGPRAAPARPAAAAPAAGRPAPAPHAAARAAVEPSADPPRGGDPAPRGAGPEGPVGRPRPPGAVALDAAVTGAAGELTRAPRGAAERPESRLPRAIAPTRYAARLAIDPRRDGFDGRIAITGEVSEATDAIWLHARGLTIQRAVARPASSGPRPAVIERSPGAAVASDSDEISLIATPHAPDRLELRGAEPLRAGTWTIEIDYAGAFERVGTVGALKQVVDGRAYVYTQLEATYAGRVFPCIDEPDVEVPWQLTLDVPADVTAVASAPAARELRLPGGGRRIEHAATRPLLSSRVAFGVGPFDVVAAGATRSGAPVRVLALAGRAREAAHAAKTSARIVDLAEEWLGSPYPHDKLDLVAIPLAAGLGAIERAGLITVSETLILHDPMRPARANLYAWDRVAAREVAHQWLGDGVTPASSDDRWLSEGLAGWLGAKLVARLEPAWREGEAALRAREAALTADALATARAVRQPIERTADIAAAFDRTTYDKGASVIAMFEGYVGAAGFQRGVRRYLAERAAGSGTASDFIAAIASAAGARTASRGAAPDAEAGARRVAESFASFLDQPGAPEIAVELECRGGEARAQLAQRRHAPPGAPALAPSAPWIVPVCVAYDRAGQRAETCGLLDDRVGRVALPGAGRACPRWLLANAGGRGYYRTAYTAAQIAALRDEAWPQLSGAERRALAFDVGTAALTGAVGPAAPSQPPAASAAGGRVPLALSLSLSPRLVTGVDRLAVEAALGMALALDALVPPRLRDKYELYLRRTFGPAAREVGLAGKAGDSLDAEELRGRLVTAVARLGREPVLVAEAVALFERGWRELPAAIRGAVLDVAVDAREDAFERALRDVRVEPDRRRRGELLRALARVRDPARQRRALALLIDPRVDARESIALLDAATEANAAIAREVFRAHQAAILRRLAAAESAWPLARLSSVLTARCRAEERDEIAADVLATFGPLPGGARVVAQSLEAMDQCIAQRARLGPDVRAWLEGIRIPTEDTAAPRAAPAAPRARRTPGRAAPPRGARPRGRAAGPASREPGGARGRRAGPR